METPFGNLTVCDAHSHLFSYRFFTTLARELPGTVPEEEALDTLRDRLPFELPDAEPVNLARRWVAELDRHGVSRIVLIASVPGDEESVAAAARAYPNRIVPYFMLDPTGPEAPTRVERAFSELGFKGVCLFPAMHRFHAWDRRLFAIFERIQAHRGIVFVHCGHLRMGVRDKLGLPSRFDMRFANPVDLDGVAKAFPDMPFVLPHFGCGYFRELLLLADQCDNVYTDTSSSNGWMRLMPYSLDLKSVYAKTLEVLGPERILFGTDSSFFPRGWRRDVFDAQVGIVGELGVSRLHAAQIFGNNLTRLVGG
jgi:predicted TIM-barrel fold metal-dependent hydrolase